jgi:hypothetical protein
MKIKFKRVGMTVSFGLAVLWGGLGMAKIMWGQDEFWRPASNGEVPRGAFRAGGEEGNPLFVCRAAHEGGLHPGKIRRDFDGCLIPFGGKEIHEKNYEVLVGMEDARWIPASNGQIPRFAFKAGYEGGESMFVCRGRIEGGLHPGKIRSGFDGCLISYGGGERHVPNYEVLIRER